MADLTYDDGEVVNVEVQQFDNVLGVRVTCKECGAVWCHSGDLDDVTEGWWWMCPGACNRCLEK